MECAVFPEGGGVEGGIFPEGGGVEDRVFLEGAIILEGTFFFAEGGIREVGIL